MGESADVVKALRAKFHTSAHMAHSSHQDAGPARYPLPGFGREVLPRPGGQHGGRISQNGVARHKLSPMVPPSPSGGSSPSTSHGPPRFSGPARTETGSPGPRPALSPMGVFPRPLAPGGVVRAAPSSTRPANSCGRIRPSEELLQNIMLSHQRPGPSAGAAKPASLKPLTATSVRPLPASQRIQAEVAPLRKPLPPSTGPQPPTPKRPPHVNLEPYCQRTTVRRGSLQQVPPSPARPARLKHNDGSLSSGGSNLSLPALVSPAGPLRPPYKPSSLPRQCDPIQFDEDQDTYDDIDTLLERNDSWTDCSSQPLTGGSDDSEVYEIIDESQLELKKGFSEKKTEVKTQGQQEDKRQQKERLKGERELRKKFQIKGEVEVLYVARVRQDWHGGKLDLNVHQGDRVEILRVKDNPGGRWLARTLNGDYGYISNTCVDVDYDEVKRKVLRAKGLDAYPLPPPPPDPCPPASHHPRLPASHHPRLPPPQHDLRLPPSPDQRLPASHHPRLPPPQHDLRLPPPQHDLRLPPPQHDLRLPPPHPDPPLTDDIYYDVDSGDHMDSSSRAQENDFMGPSVPVDFPAPPHEIRIDPKVEMELRKRFKYEGPLTVLHTMMVDPNGIIRKPGGKDLAVAQGEILDVIQLTNDTKALCRNQYRRYGYVSRALLLQMEGDDIYDDVDTFNDADKIYDNDNLH